MWAAPDRDRGRSWTGRSDNHGPADRDGRISQPEDRSRKRPSRTNGSFRRLTPAIRHRRAYGLGQSIEEGSVQVQAEGFETIALIQDAQIVGDAGTQAPSAPPNRGQIGDPIPGIGKGVKRPHHPGRRIQPDPVRKPPVPVRVVRHDDGDAPVLRRRPAQARPARRQRRDERDPIRHRPVRQHPAFSRLMPPGLRLEADGRG